MCNNRFVMVFAVMFMTLGVTSAGAVPITFGFSGKISSVSDPNNVLGGGIDINDDFMGQLVFESTTPDSDPDSTRGAYEFPGGSLIVQAGNLEIENVIPTIRLSYSAWSSYYSIGGQVPFTAADMQIVEFAPLGLYNSSQVFTNDSLPLTPPALTDFSSRTFWMQGRPIAGGELFTIQGQVQTFFPEPGSLLLMCVVYILINARRVNQ